jgi:hypothetical protein
MIASLLVMMLFPPANASEPRQAYSSCLSKFAETSADKKVSAQDFETALASACAAEEAAFRKNVVDSDVSRGISRKTSEQGIADEITEYRAETKDRFASATAASAPAPPPSAPTTQATPAAATTPN